MSEYIFKYHKTNPWASHIASIDIYDRDENSLEAYKGYNYEEASDSYDLNKETRDKIKELILSYEKLFDANFIPEDNYDLDAKISNIYFNAGDKQTSFSILNIHNLKECENVSYILDLLKEIKEVLLEAGVDEKYFIL